ncbi:MAG: hypothetical protein JWQ07_1017 [Ramlibacter sp.]|nr:hypothetical protein [Ramlibacter sp.]
MNHLKSILLCSLLATASMQAMSACYTVYDRSNRVVYNGDQPPVDMSRPIHETVPMRFPGGHMIFDTNTECPAIVALTPAPVLGGTPLLTNERTAQAMNLPHTTLAGGIALVRSRDAVIAPGVTIVPATVTELAMAPRSGRDTVITEWRNPEITTVETADRNGAGSATRMMGAGPAPLR